MQLTNSDIPKGFSSFVTNLGIKDNTDDFVLIKSEVSCVADGVFTQSLFAGASVTLSRRNLTDAQAQGIIVISKNANVANGAIGVADAEEIIQIVANETGIATKKLFKSSQMKLE